MREGLSATQAANRVVGSETWVFPAAVSPVSSVSCPCRKPPSSSASTLDRRWITSGAGTSANARSSCRLDGSKARKHVCCMYCWLQRARGDASLEDGCAGSEGTEQAAGRDDRRRHVLRDVPQQYVLCLSRWQGVMTAKAQKAPVRCQLCLCCKLHNGAADGHGSAGWHSHASSMHILG